MKHWVVYFLSVAILSGGQMSYSEYLMRGTRAAFTAPSNVTLMGGAAIAVLALRGYDDDIQRFSQEQGFMSDGFSHQLDLYGGRWAYPVLIGMSCLTPGSKSERVERLKLSFSAVGVTAMTTWLIKGITSRERPNGSDKRSFPSGHTSGSFTVAAVVEELYSKNAGSAAYLLAALVGAHRIHDDKHWLTDVIAGAALGTAVGKGFSQIYREAENGSGASLIPDWNKGSVMVTVVMPIN
tara:strand:+ start:67 stop:780 length:714 start_codon:yes stop_codon:yes gene_type:complete